MKVVFGYAIINSIFQQATFKGIPLSPQILKKKTQLVVKKIFSVIWKELWI